MMLNKLKRLIIPVIIFILLFTLVGYTADLFGTYGKRIKLTIDNTKIDSELTWFPVTVFLTSTQGEEVFAEFDADEDFDRVAFTTSDGETQLYANCELFDDSESKAIYHVSKTGWVIDSDVDTDFFIYYDNNADHNTTYISKSGGTAGQSVWDSNFKAIYHLHDCVIGSEIIDRSDNFGRLNTSISKDNPANRSGIIKSIQVWFYTQPTNDAIVATFYRPDPDNFPNYFTARDSYKIGKPASGSEKTIAVELNVEEGDYIGFYGGGGASGNMELDTSGGSGIWTIAGDYTGCTNQEFSFNSGWVMSLGSYTITDATSNTNQGTKKSLNEPIEATGKVGQGQDFDGDDDNIALPISSSLNPETGDFTIEAIVKTSNVTNYRAIFDNREGLANGEGIAFYIWQTTGVGRFAIEDHNGNNPAIYGTTDLSNGEYHHLVGCRDKTNSKLKIYVDGSSDATDVNDTTNSTVNSGVSPRIGIDVLLTNYPFDDVIDEIRISKTLRTPAWIKATYNSLWDTLLTYGSEETTPVVKKNILFRFTDF